MIPSEPFDGETYVPGRDGKRLGRQLDVVERAMSDGAWHTLDELVSLAGGTTASVSARLRDLRKTKFGNRDIERAYVSAGLWRYRWNTPEPMPFVPTPPAFPEGLF